ncbi:Gfo/Idh/MocA family oxidoreductase [Gammaproteobacteria bacterium]|nr:Gfo/Idh/MocA family oxidoreductase [Gammaproteobacteria bacterium]
MPVGITGYGVVGKTRLQSTGSNTSHNVTAISESSEEARKFIPKSLDVYHDYESLVANVDIDVIFISLPNKFAAEAACLSLQNGLYDLNMHIPTKVGEYGPAEDLHMMMCGLLGSYFNKKFLNA